MMKSALLIIDVQNGMFTEGKEVYRGKTLLDKISNLITKARATDTQIIYVQHNAPAGRPLETGTVGWEIHSHIFPQVEDVIIQKSTPDSFHHTSLEEELKLRNIGHLYITGIQTEVCVDTTCRRAFSMGYKVILISDSHSTWDSEEITAQQIMNHHNNVLRWFAEVLPSDEVDFHL
ncbi:cysteine hydrolase family protein [Bacillus suaedaesalsae]|uniref:Cysteine hydrolase n=1 Tax=Bacillus suaedaesalsae TaxID=2810349 RepID=A0ABS2DH70_9BACI|nr:cysteine hydrolase family protein [Bacillus suaedaesalsae]MBM6617824.1 cysteine hydrolase [Bacillus suaedaesalsae]